MDLNTTRNEMMAAEAAMKPYQDSTLPTQTKEAVMQQWTPLLKSATGAAQSQMAEFLPKYMGMAEQLGGTSETDLSPTQKLQFMGQRLGDMSGQLYNATALADYYGGKASEMATAAQTALQYGNQTAAAAYDRAFQRYNTAWQAAENEKNRQATIRAAQISATTNTPTIPTGGTGTGGNSIDTDKMTSSELQAFINSAGSALSTGQRATLQNEVNVKRAMESQGTIKSTPVASTSNQYMSPKTTTATQYMSPKTTTVSVPSYSGNYGLIKPLTF